MTFPSSDPSSYSDYCGSPVLLQGKNYTFEGNENCVHLLVLSALRTLDAITKHNQLDWRLKNFKRQVYPHQPFTNTALKFIFDRDAVTEGGRRTAAVSRYFYADMDPEKGKWIKVVSSAINRMVYDFSGEGYFALDTGVSGNVFSRHYFDMNEDHENGNLYRMIFNRTEIEHVHTTKLVLEPHRNQHTNSQHHQKDSL